MRCIVCHSGETRAGSTTVAFSRGGLTVVIRDVPAAVCENCGEAYVDEDVTSHLLAFASQARETGASIVVRDYNAVPA